MNRTAANRDDAGLRRIAVADRQGFGLAVLRNGSQLSVELLPNGGVFAIRHRSTLINQVLPGPAADGLFRLLLRDRAGGGSIALAGAGIPFAHDGRTATWSPAGGELVCSAALRLHPDLPAWAWVVSVVNTGSAPRRVDVLLAHDLGLADEGAVRNNEAYTSHYIDFHPVRDPALGWALLARQNQPMEGGRHPWLAAACATGATGYCTDGWDFFGADHRLTGRPAAEGRGLPSRVLQYEMALAGLQSREAELAPGRGAEFAFVVRYSEDHPAASGPADLAVLNEAGAWWRSSPATEPPAATGGVRSLFLDAPWMHGENPSDADLAAWFPGPMRHVERGERDEIRSFFSGDDTHVVARGKEATALRPTGHILRSGDWRWFDAGHFGVTCHAAGVFGTQAYLGHPSFARLVSVARNALNLNRGAGQRVFVKLGGAWSQLGVASAFAMTPGEARWIYRFGDAQIEARVWCPQDAPASLLSLRSVSGQSFEFLVTHELALGAAEFDHAAEIAVDEAAGWAACIPGRDTLVGRHQPGVAFAIAAVSPGTTAVIGGDELLHADGLGRSGPYLVLRSAPTTELGVVMTGTPDGVPTLAAAVESARAAFRRGPQGARPPASPVRIRGAGDRGIGRIDEILPWFAHNAAIHFSAPHGLEQYGGAAWGVRDVCQGSVEWLLSAGDHGAVRRILETVFAQQYPDDGGWPQWFMFPPYRFIQQAHSHGDICFWPLKALCDYLEASDDLGFLQAKLGYTDRTRFEPAGPEETVLAHCDRIVAQCESRFVPGTALVNYGDGDWDDTLQPADPSLRTRMVSAWTVGLAFHAFRQFATVCRRVGEAERAGRLEALCAHMRADFERRLMPDGVVAGFLVTESDGTERPLLHPRDGVTGIRYRLLPMTRSILAELFTPAEARRHLALIRESLCYPDGARLMSEPAAYHGGLERLFRRAETAANVGREIGLQYVHAHLRYAEALAKVGDADALWWALQAVNPVDLRAVVPQADARQANVYFSSSDADFANRHEAQMRWPELRSGGVHVRGGWRLYSSGPGLFIHKVCTCLLGLREVFDEVVFDPVLPASLDGLIARAEVCGRPVEVLYRVFERNSGPRSVTVNGLRCAMVRREANPYRPGGLAVPKEAFRAMLKEAGNVVLVEL